MKRASARRSKSKRIGAVLVLCVVACLGFVFFNDQDLLGVWPSLPNFSVDAFFLGGSEIPTRPDATSAGSLKQALKLLLA